MILYSIFIAVGLLFLLVFSYLFFLAAASIWPEKRQKRLPPRTHFAIIIPAHNESDLIGKTIQKTKEIDYPGHLFEIIVVADNCEDDTEEIVRKSDVLCWRRNDPDNRGKGNVLRWVFPRLLEYGNHDAFVIIDADTHMAPDFLLEVNDFFCRGAKVVQGYSQARHPERSPMESLAFLGFALNRNLRYRGRTRLGWTTNLMGTGMCFSREVIQQHGWNTTTMVEDIEYEMHLHLNDIKVAFAYHARINVEIHKSVKQSKGQRTRWDMGKFEVRNRYLPQLIKKGIKDRDISYLDSSMELLLPPFSLFCFIVTACYVLYLLFGFNGIDVTFYIWTAVFLSLILYILSGLVTVKANIKVYCALLLAPLFIVWRAWIVLMELLKRNKQRQW